MDKITKFILKGLNLKRNQKSMIEQCTNQVQREIIKKIFSIKELDHLRFLKEDPKYRNEMPCFGYPNGECQIALQADLPESLHNYLSIKNLLDKYNLESDVHCYTSSMQDIKHPFDGIKFRAFDKNNVNYQKDKPFYYWIYLRLNLSKFI